MLKKFSKNFQIFFLKIEKTIFLSEISTSIFSSVHHLLKTHQMTLKPRFYFSPDPGEHSRYFDHGQKVKIHQNMTKGSFWIKGASECTAMRTPFKKVVFVLENWSQSDLFAEEPVGSLQR